MKVLAGLVALVVALALAGGGGDSAERHAHGLLRPRGGARPAAVRPVRGADGHQARRSLRRSAELAATLAEEGGNSPADVFFAQDAGSLGAVDGRARAAPAGDARPRRRALPRHRRPLGRDVGPLTRARLQHRRAHRGELPDSVLDLTDPAWKGKIGIAPTNASFQAFVTAMRLTAGEERTRSGSRPEENDAEDLREEHADLEASPPARSSSGSSTTTTSTC